MKWILILLLPIVSFAQTRQTAAQYVEKYKETAQTEMRRYGIPASIKLGQGILESSAGNSDLAREANNHFGIKCKKNWTGQAFYKDDDAKDECFRKYKTVLESYEDHSQFLKNSQRYASLFLLSQDDYKGWAHGLKKAGYATNPQYAQLLIKTIEENRLFQYDTEVIAKPYTPDKQKDKPKEELVEDLPPTSKQEVKLRNNVKYVIAKDGDTPENLSEKFDMIPFQIPKYNDLTDNEYKFKSGDIVYLQPKRNKASEKLVVVKQGQTIRDISQEYGIKIKSIRKLNKLSESEEVKVGQELRLR